MTETYDTMLEKVKAFVVEKLGLALSGLTENTKLEQDAGLAGMETLIFYDDFFTEFRIRNPEDFNADRYVTSETPEFGKVIRALFSKARRRELRARSVTLRHLAQVALRREWFEE